MDTRGSGTLAPGPLTGEPSIAVPPVVAVVVTHDPGAWFEETLAGLAGQTYPDLSILVIDAGSAEDPTARIAAVMPGAYVRRLGRNDGFGASANTVLGIVEGAAFYLLCHDDVALEPDAVRSLVEEAFRSNAGIVGPKLVDWHDPRRLLQVGMDADKTGAVVPIAERGELDQEQHDRVRDVFVVPGACTLIRADLFEHLGGFDDGIDFHGDDLDLCWRGHIAGARVLIVPQARARHVEALGERRPTDDRRRLQARHRLRTVLGSYRPVGLARVVPQALFFTLVEAVYALGTGRGGHARDIVAAWPWNARHLAEVRRKRSGLRSVRAVGDREIRELQIRGSARFSSYLRGQLGREEGSSAWGRSSADQPGGRGPGSRAWALAAAAVLTGLLVMSARGLITGRIPAVGELARFPSSPGTLLRSWTSGWRTAGLGSDAPAPTGLGLLGLLGLVFGGAMGVLRKVLILGTLPLGAWGAWRLARPIGSRRAAVVALAVYVAIPVPYNALARGSWSGLLLHAASPWILLMLARASEAEPFGRAPTTSSAAVPGTSAPADAPADGPAGGPVGGPVGRRRVALRRVLGLGLLVGVVAAFVPFVVAVVLGVGVALAIGSLACLRPTGSARMLAVALGACLVAAVLNLPWSSTMLARSGGWTAFAGARAASQGPLPLGRLLRFQSGPFGAPPLGWAFLLAAALPVVIGRSWRLDWAVRAWFVAVAGWGLAWAGEVGWLGGGLAPVEVLLAPVAAALALAAALGMAAFEVDLRAYRFGWRQVLSVFAALGVLLGGIPMLSGLVDGRWRMPGRDFNQSLAQLFEPQRRAPYRALWLGDPDVLPLAGWRLDHHVAYGTTDHGTPDITDRWAGPGDRSTRLIGDAVRTAEQGRTTRLGRLLAPMGVRYLIVPWRLAPPPHGGERRPPPRRLRTALAEQLDLEQVPIGDDITIYRNRAWIPTRAVLPPSTGRHRSFTDAVTEDLTSAPPALTHQTGPTSAEGSVPRAGRLLLASAWSPNWQLRIDGRLAPHGRLFGWANGYRVRPSANASLTYRTSPWRRLSLVGQCLLWLLAIGGLLVGRRLPIGSSGRLS